MAGTVQKEVRSSLITILAALPALDGVRVSYAFEGGRSDRERIFTARARTAGLTQKLKSGTAVRDEDVDFDLVITVEGVGLSAEATDDRATELSDVVEGWLADNKNGAALSVSGLNWIRPESWEIHNLFNDRGSLTELTYVIRYNARLT